MWTYLGHNYVVYSSLVVVQGSDMQGRCNKYSERFVEVAAQVSALGAEKGKTDHDQLVSKAVEGTAQLAST